MRAENGLVLASDSRGTFGDPRSTTTQNDSMKKLYVLCKFASLGMTGAGEIGAGLNETIMPATTNASGITEAVQVTYKILREGYRNMFQGFQMQPVPGVTLPVRPDLGVIVSGYDYNKTTKSHTSQIYSMHSTLDFAPSLHEYGFAVQGVPLLAVYLLNRLYRTDILLNEAVALAAYTISETAEQDGKVGGPIQMITMTPGKAPVSIKQEKIDRALRENERRNDRLRESFFKRD